MGFRKILFILFLLLLCVGGAGAYQLSILNPNFATQPNGTDWSEVGSSGRTWNQTDGSSDTYSYELTRTSTDVDFYSGYIPVNPSTNYSLSYYSKKYSGAGYDRVYILQFNGTNQVTMGYNQTAGLHAWAQKHVNFTTSSNVNQIKIRGVHATDNGISLFDNFVLTTPSDTTQWDIYDAQTLTGQTRYYNANITVYPGGSLTLVNSSLIFDNTVSGEHGIKVLKGNTTSTTAGKLVVSNSTITGNSNYHTYIWSEYYEPIGSKTPIIQADDSIFEYMGVEITSPTWTVANNQSWRTGIEIHSSNPSTYFDNCSIKHCYNGLWFSTGGSPANVTNCTIDDIESAAIKTNSVGLNILNNNINNSRFCVYAQYTNGMNIINNTFSAGSRASGSYCIDILGNPNLYAEMDRYFNISNNIITGVQRSIVLNVGTRDGLVKNNTISNATGVGVGMGDKAYNITVDGNRFTDVQDAVLATYENITVTNNIVTNPWIPTGYTAAFRCEELRNSTFYNNTVTNVDQTTTKGIYIYDSINVTFDKCSFSSMPTAIDLHANNTNIFFRDTVITESTTDVNMAGTEENVKFLNPSYNISKVSVSDTGTFKSYYYANIFVKNLLDQPVKNAVIASNESSIDQNGNTIESELSTVDGDTTNLFAVLSDEKTSSATTSHTPLLTATKNGINDTETATPSVSWYSSDTNSLSGSQIPLVLDTWGAVPPVSAFSATPRSGQASTIISFTDSSSGADSWAWDFENDGSIDSVEQNPTHAYTSAGTNTVNLTVSNEFGSDSEVKSEYITISANSGTDPLMWLVWWFKSHRLW